MRVDCAEVGFGSGSKLPTVFSLEYFTWRTCTRRQGHQTSGFV